MCDGVYIVYFQAFSNEFWIIPWKVRQVHAQSLKIRITLQLLLNKVFEPAMILQVGSYPANCPKISIWGAKNTVIKSVRACAGLMIISASLACATEPSVQQSLATEMKSAPNLTGTNSKAKNLTSEQMKNNNPEPVSGFKFDGNTIVADVISHGCTRNDDFRIEHVVSQNQCMLVVTRIKPDFCRRAPMLQTINVEWQVPAECQSLPIVLSNPVLVAPESGVPSKRLK